MIFERSDIQFPMWRKKVDRSLLQQGVTPLPAWVASMWGIDVDFRGVESKKVKDASVSVLVTGIPSADVAWVTSLSKGRTSPLYRLFVGDVAKTWLRRSFRMSYLRALKSVLLDGNDANAEDETSFWEFVDIEYDRCSRLFYLVAHYNKQALCPNAPTRIFEGCPIEGLSEEASNDPCEDATCTVCRSTGPLR